MVSAVLMTPNPDSTAQGLLSKYGIVVFMDSKKFLTPHLAILQLWVHIRKESHGLALIGTMTTNRRDLTVSHNSLNEQPSSEKYVTIREKPSPLIHIAPKNYYNKS
jgi:hypothetical protein